MKTIRINNKQIERDELLTLLELFVYYKMSYPAGCHDTCEIQLDDKNSRLITKDIIYSIDGDTYLYLHLQSNTLIAAMYAAFYKDNESL